MNNMISECRNIEGLFQEAKDEAQREAFHPSPSYNSRRPSRPFQLLVTAQGEKNRRDRSYRDRLSREQKHEQQKHDRREQDLDRAMQPAKTTVGGKHQRGKRSMASVSLFFRAVRPISTAWGSERTPSRARTASELDFPVSGKPSLVLSLNEARATAFESEDRPYLFQLSTEDGGRWILQATSSTELDSWTRAIDTASRKRSTYLPQTAKLLQPDPIMPYHGGGAGRSTLHIPN